MSRVLMVGCSELTARLPEALSGHGLELIALGTEASPFRHSRFIDHFVALPGSTSREDWITTLLANPALAPAPHDWIIHADDALPLALARCPIPAAQRLTLLPIRKLEGLQMVGSKVGLAQLLHQHQVPTPHSLVVHEPAGLPAALQGFQGPLMVKAERGACGECLRRYGERDAVLADPPPLEWYPLVVQAWVAGTDLGVDALFGQGNLLGLQASQALQVIGAFSPSLSRRFLPSASPEVVDVLQSLGRAAGLHGLFNCTLRLPADGSRPLLFEADPRPTAWCAFGPRLGVDWGALMAASDPTPQPCQPLNLPPTGLAVHLFPRAPEYALRTLSWSVARPWLLARPGTWDVRLREDAAVEAWEWQRLRQAIRDGLLRRPLQVLAAALSARWRRRRPGFMKMFGRR